MVLASCSPFFHSMITSNMVECATSSAKLEHDDPVSLRRMFQYIYTRDIRCECVTFVILYTAFQVNAAFLVVISNSVIGPSFSFRAIFPSLNQSGKESQDNSKIEDFLELLSLSDKYQIDELREKLEDYLIR